MVIVDTLGLKSGRRPYCGIRTAGRSATKSIAALLRPRTHLPIPGPRSSGVNGKNPQSEQKSNMFCCSQGQIPIPKDAIPRSAKADCQTECAVCSGKSDLGWQPDPFCALTSLHSNLPALASPLRFCARIVRYCLYHNGDSPRLYVKVQTGAVCVENEEGWTCYR